MSDGSLYVGIDLGTTNSSVACFDGQRVSVVRNAAGSPLTPSVVRVDARGRVTVGSKARRLLDTDPANTQAEFKRLMGSTTRRLFAASGLSRTPEELAAEVLKSLRLDVEQQLEVLPSRAVISVPALFEVPQCAATRRAAELAGFERIELIQEPVASSLAAGWTDSSTGFWLVYDLGGGTFDVSLLETRHGILTVVGHDGDNFLGGRDFDMAVVDLLIESIQKEHGVVIDRTKAEHHPAVVRLKLLAEEARIELSRSRETEIEGVLDVAGDSVDLSITLDRDRLESLVEPIVQRTLDVCERLLASKRLPSTAIERVVLVGGPTAMPRIRVSMRERLGAAIAEGVDPMTLVAQGAALFAATSGLDARPTATAGSGDNLWLRWPAITPDVSPIVVGRVIGQPGGPATIVLRRTDGLWTSDRTLVETDGTFTIQCALLPRRTNKFTIEGLSAEGSTVAVSPSALTILHGVTVGDPPLSRSIGIALADDRVEVYFEKGTPLPTRRTYRHRLVEAVAPGIAGPALRVPVVQGEASKAHLCRCVGTLEIDGCELRGALNAGSEIEVVLELDRGGALTARALIAALQQSFSTVAQLLTPEASPPALATGIIELRQRLAALRAGAFRSGAKGTLSRLSGLEDRVRELELDVERARGGDEDAGQKARRGLLDVDGTVDLLEDEQRLPALAAQSRLEIAWTREVLVAYGTPNEQRLADETIDAVEAARSRGDVVEFERQLRVLRQIATAAHFRHPEAWLDALEHAASRAENALDPQRAHALVIEGRRARELGDHAGVRSAVTRLWELLPPSRKDRRLGFDSSLY